MDPANAHQVGLWQKVVEAQPESTDTRLREGITRVVGSLDHNSVVLATQATRADWLVQPAPKPNHQPDLSPVLYAGEDVLPTLRRALDVTLGETPEFNRLAFGVSLIRQVAEPQSALREISAYLPSIDFSSMEGPDFVHQLNRRRPSTAVPHVLINRLARWSISQVGAIQIRIWGQSPVHASDIGTARQLLLDVNTAPAATAIPTEKAPRLFEELLVLAAEIATEGDIP